MGKITKNYIFNVIYQIFVMIVPLVTAPYLARTLGAGALGEYSYVNSVTSMVTTFTLLGIYQYGNRQIAYVREDKNKITSVFWQVISSRVVIAIFGSIIYVLIIALIGRYTTLFLIYYTYVLAYYLDCTWLYVGVEDMKWAVIKNTITKILAIIGIFCFVKTTDDIAIYVGIQGASLLISNLLAYSQVSKFVGKPRFDLSNFKQDMKESMMLFLPSIAATIYFQSDRIMIEMITNNTAEVSFYDYAEKIVTIPLTFITVLSTVMMPRIANEYSKGNSINISILINRAAKFSVFIAMPMMLGVMCVADKLVPWYLGSEYTPAITGIILISPIIMSNTLTGISGSQYFVATKQINLLIRAQTFAAIANIIINAILIPKYGFIGAAIATITCSFSNAIIQYFYLQKQVKLPGLWKSCFKYLIFGLVMAAIIRLITNSMSATVLTNIIQVLIGLLVYFALCLISRDEQMKFLLFKVGAILHIKKR